jgi:hypothetical protein
MTNFHFFNKPGQFKEENGVITFVSAGETDFWQQTHYNFARDNGHFIYWDHLPQNVKLEATCQIDATHRYDQAGLMLRGNSSNWLKTSAEWLDSETCAIGSVNTKAGYSDWASYESTPNRCYRFRIEIQGVNAYVSIQINGRWSQLRILDISHIRATGQFQLGLYACSPKGPGTHVEFRDIQLLVSP